MAKQQGPQIDGVTVVSLSPDVRVHHEPSRSQSIVDELPFDRQLQFDEAESYARRLDEAGVHDLLQAIPTALGPHQLYKLHNVTDVLIESQGHHKLLKDSRKIVISTLRNAQRDLQYERPDTMTLFRTYELWGALALTLDEPEFYTKFLEVLGDCGSGAIPFSWWYDDHYYRHLDIAAREQKAALKNPSYGDAREHVALLQAARTGLPIEQVVDEACLTRASLQFLDRTTRLRQVAGRHDGACATDRPEVCIGSTLSDRWRLYFSDYPRDDLSIPERYGNLFFHFVCRVWWNSPYERVPTVTLNESFLSQDAANTDKATPQLRRAVYEINKEFKKWVKQFGASSKLIDDAKRGAGYSLHRNYRWICDDATCARWFKNVRVDMHDPERIDNRW